ncbi:hypothetical protein ABPG74_006081 [Tetrahymena malaccensis]
MKESLLRKSINQSEDSKNHIEDEESEKKLESDVAKKANEERKKKAEFMKKQLIINQNKFSVIVAFTIIIFLVLNGFAIYSHIKNK